ncbi:unnamed protein product, partial [Arctia plantaginis]
MQNNCATKIQWHHCVQVVLLLQALFTIPPNIRQALALEGDRAAIWPVGQYAPEVLDLEQWTEDSGISSDDTIDRMRRLGQSSGEDSRNNSDENLYKDQ